MNFKEINRVFAAVVLCGCMFCTNSINANPDGVQRVYSLTDCLEEGLQNNYSLKIERNSQRISDNNATIGNAGFLPTLDASASYRGNAGESESKLRENESIVKQTGVFDQTIDVGVNLSWTVFEGFSVRTNYKKLKELQVQGELKTRTALENLVADITAEYYNYIQQTIRLKNLKYAVELSKERLRIVQQRYRIGSFSGLDYQQAKVDFNADSSDYMKQQEALQTSAIRLNELMAREQLDVPIVVEDSLIGLEKALVLELLLSSMLDKNVTLLYARKNSSIAELDYKRAVSKSYPYLRLNAGYGYNYNKYNKGANYYRSGLDADFGVTLGINIFNGNTLRTERRNARINAENVMLEQADVEQSLKATLYNLWQAYRNNLNILKLESDNLTVAKDNYSIAKERYMLGDLSGIEMREAQQSLLDAEERLLTARYNTKLCEISLLQISGDISFYLQ